MRAALREARRGVGRTAPNPPVGAVIVKNGRLLAAGWHRAAGCPHAEVEAVRRLPDPELARGADLYVTLEPCSTSGRTPPCTDLILRCGFRRVFAGAVDPNPAHAGRGLDILRGAGVEVVTGVCQTECQALIRPFAKLITTGRPWVIAKAAMTLDGSLTLPEADGRWLSSEPSLKAAARLRSECDAVLIGAGTLRADNPRLTIRTGRSERAPWRVVFAGQNSRLPRDARLFTDAFREKTLVFKGVKPGRVLDELGSRGVMTLLIEGGGETHAAFFSAGLVDEAAFFLTPWIAGGGVPALGGAGGGLFDAAGRWRFSISAARHTRCGPDILCRGLVVPAAAQAAM